MRAKNETIPSVICMEEAASTNHEMRVLADAGILENESALMAASQTAGRGQGDAVWEAEPGKNLTCSLLYYPVRLPANRSFVMAEIAALSVKRSVEQFVTGVTVKWPNDVYWMDRKLCGILIENVIDGGCVARSIIGTGLNLNQVIFRGAAPNPVSLLQITGLACDPLYMLDLLRNEFHLLAGRLADGRAEEIHREYVASLYRAEAFYPYEDAGGRFVARIRDIEPSGHLLLERLDGSLSRYAFKEVCYKNEE